MDISTTAGADVAIAAMDSALSALNAGRADLGAYQNRFSSAISNVQTTSENLTASRSRIVDTDFAAETATLSRNQVLQQAGTAMLAQANAMPQSGAGAAERVKVNGGISPYTSETGKAGEPGQHRVVSAQDPG